MKKLVLSFTIISFFLFSGLLAKAQNPYWIFPNNTGAGEVYDVSLGQPVATLPTTNPENSNLPYTDVFGTDGGYVPALLPHRGAANSIPGRKVN